MAPFVGVVIIEIGVTVENKKLYTLAEISDYLGLPEETVYKYARHGRIPASKIGRFWRFDLGEVDQWVGRHSNRAPDELNVLVVDDDEMIRTLLARWLEDAGCKVVTVGSGDEAIREVQAQKFTVVFLDLMMPGINGVETLAGIKQHDKDCEVCIVTGHFESPLMEKAMDMGPLTMIRKPVEKETLLSMVAGYQALKPDQF